MVAKPLPASAFTRSNWATALSAAALAEASWASADVDRRLAGDDLLADAGDRRLAGGDLRLGPVEGVAVVGIVEDDQRVAGLDAGVVGRRHRLDVAGDLGGHGRGVGADIGVVGGDDEAADRSTSRSRK